MSTCELMKEMDDRPSSFIDLKNRNAVMFNNKLMADVYFLVGSSENIQKIPAHKYVLAIGSVVFRSMFFGSLSEKDEIKIPDVEPSGFLTLLQFLYCDEIMLNDDNVSCTLYAAKKYQVQHVINVCLDYVEVKLGGKNVWLFLNNWKLFDDISFKQKCWKAIEVDTKSALEAENFVHINEKILQKLLNRETLNCKEADVFKAVVKWVDFNYACRENIKTNNKQNFLGNLKYLIRIPTMTLKEFSNIVVNSGLLSQEEIINIFMYYTADKKPDLSYSVIPRAEFKPQFHRLQIYFSSQSLDPSSISFKVDKSIFIVGLKYLFRDYSVNMKLSIALKKLDRVLAKRDFTNIYINNKPQFEIYFEHPIRVQPNTFYSILSRIESFHISSFTDTHFHTNNSVVKQNSVDVQFQCQVSSGRYKCDAELIFYR